MKKFILKKIQKGFTPMELLLVIGISAVVAGLFVFTANAPQQSSALPPINVNVGQPNITVSPPAVNVNVGRADGALAAKVFDTSTGAQVGTVDETGACKYVGQDKLVCPSTPAQDTQDCLAVAGEGCLGDSNCILTVTQDCVSALDYLNIVATSLNADGTCPAVGVIKNRLSKFDTLAECPGRFAASAGGSSCFIGNGDKGVRYAESGDGAWGQISAGVVCRDGGQACGGGVEFRFSCAEEVCRAQRVVQVTGQITELCT